MSTPLIFIKDLNGFNTFLLGLSDLGVDTTLAPNVEQTTIVPENVNVAVLEYAVGTNVFVDIGTAPISLPGAAFSDSTKRLNPSGVKVIPGQTLRFICDTASYVEVSYFRTPN